MRWMRHRTIMGLAIAIGLVSLAPLPWVELLATESYEQKAVAAVLMGEARGEGEKGMTAVAEVIHQRAKIWDASALWVVTRPKHFSCLNDTSLSRLIGRFRDHSRFPTALKIAKTMLSEPQRLPGLTRGATHFATITSSPYWTEGQRPVAVIGNHVFYKLDL